MILSWKTTWYFPSFLLFVLAALPMHHKSTMFFSGRSSYVHNIPSLPDTNCRTCQLYGIGQQLLASAQSLHILDKLLTPILCEYHVTAPAEFEQYPGVSVKTNCCFAGPRSSG